ncbi:MAG: radical SAM protein [Verrucomicrobia bacterium]|nr:radical SAM protein [Verrucomicrobiota bacterium]
MLRCAVFGPKAVKTGLTIAHRSHSRTYREFCYVYPVISRRSHGLSIGINLNPNKACNFHCVYCQVDRATPPRVSMLVLSTLERELREMVELVQSGTLASEYPFNTVLDMATRINDIALSGDGEPTTVRQFRDVVEIVTRVKRETGLQETKVVLITDCAGLDRTDVQAGLRLLDDDNGEVWAKLDAGTEQYFKQVNRTAIAFSRILKNLALTARPRPIVVQSLFVRLHGEPPPVTEIEAYCERLNEIIQGGGKIKLIQVYTVVRKPLESWVDPLSERELEAIAARIHRNTQVPVETFAGGKA